MRALVLGGTGMLGKAVVAEGRRRGAAVLGLSHVQGDVTDAERLLVWARSFRPTVVVNCAAFTAVDACEEHEAAAAAVNADGVGHAAAAAGEVGARLIHVSSDYVFAGGGTAPHPEDAPTGPLSAYGRTKLAGERRALAYDRALVVRTSWLFGPGSPNFVSTMIGLIERGTDPLRVVDDQVGAPTSTGSLARALWDLGGAASPVTGVVHYRDREPATWYDFACAIAAGWAPPASAVRVEPVTTDQFPRPARRPAYSVLAVERFERWAGRPVEPWRAGLAEYLRILRAQRVAQSGGTRT